MKVYDIARVAHEVNRAYCTALGDDSQVPWELAPDWQRQSVILGVRFHLENPNATPEASHAAWVDAKRREGWIWGAEKNAEQRIHPNLMPFDQLPVEQQVKDHLFRAVVHALRDAPEAV